MESQAIIGKQLYLCNGRQRRVNGTKNRNLGDQCSFTKRGNTEGGAGWRAAMTPEVWDTVIYSLTSRYGVLLCN